MLPGLVNGLGVAEIVGPGEVLPSAIEPPRRQQLLGPDQAQRLAQLGADQVLAALAPVQREVGGFGSHPPHQDGEQLGVLVIRMGPDHQHPLVVTEHPKLLIQRYRTARGGRLELPQNRRCEQYEMEEERDQLRELGDAQTCRSRVRLEGKAEGGNEGRHGKDVSGSFPCAPAYGASPSGVSRQARRKSGWRTQR